MTAGPRSLDAAKDLARQLRRQLARDGTEVSHGQALEQIAHQYGYRDWNALHAAIGNRPRADWVVGDRVRGHYLAQPVAATVIAVEALRPGWYRVSLDLDDPVDVVRFQGFSNLRRRVTGVIGPAGTSRETTSDGRPHLELDRPG